MKKRSNRNRDESLISCPRILISALRGSSAKTIVSIGIIVALRRRNLSVFPFKKGPDYIDAAWLSRAAGRICDHLDLYLMGEQGVREVFSKRAGKAGVSIVEGNRGLFDGVDIYGTYSTAKIASLLQIPVLLIIDCTKITNTAASLVKGCQVFDPDISLRGIILNHVAGARHGDIIRSSIEHHTGLPVLGMIPNLELNMPERHLGLTTVGETDDFLKKLQLVGDIAEEYLHLDKILEIAEGAPQLKKFAKKERVNISNNHGQKVSVGVIRDPAFQFTYQENLDALKREGASLVEFNSIQDNKIKPVDLLYIPGGFPEVHAENISKNKSFCDSIKKYSEMGLPIYGECGAVIYLGRSVVYANKKYEMCNVFPLDFELKKKPAGHGYTDVKVDKENPFFAKGITLKGHEFHYSLATNWNADSYPTAFAMKKGYGFDGKRDGIFKKNVFAAYTHLHAAGTPEWAKCLIETARKTKFTKYKHA